MLSNRKIIFVDFDDTLCIHPRGIDIYGDGLTYRQRCLLGKQDFRVSLFNQPLVDELRKAKENGSRILCLGWISDTFSIKAKQQYLDSKAAGLFEDFIGVAKREYKISTVLDYIYLYGLNLSDVLLIDDNLETLEDFEKAEIPVVHPMYLALSLQKS